METSSDGRRDSPRVKVRLKVRFKSSEAFINEYTHNISKGGIFIRTSKPCRLRDRVELVLIVPEDGSEIHTLGEVIHVVAPEDAREQMPAGMGIQILELKKEDQARIEKYIEERLNRGSEGLCRRQHARVEARLRVKFQSKEALVEEYIQNISHGGIFIASANPKQVGEEITVILTHPDTAQELMLRGEVARVVSPADAQALGIQPGMGIKFLDLEPYIISQIDEFIQAETEKVKGKDLILEET